MGKHIIISCATYDNHIGINYIPEVLVRKINKKIDKRIDIIINKGKFSIENEETYNYGINSCTSYKNSDGYELKIRNHYDSSTYVIEIEVDTRFENNIELMSVLNEIKSINVLKLNVFIKLCEKIISKKNCNKILPEENDDD